MKYHEEFDDLLYNQTALQKNQLMLSAHQCQMHRKHLAFWNEDTIQEFWSGKSWRRPDEGNSLSYDLAVHLVAIGSRDFARFRDFVNAADHADSGNAAAQAHLGYPVADLAAAVLGEGPWTPDPGKWNLGTERGQF